MPLLDPARPVARLRILVFAAAALGLVLLWGCWLVYGARIGTQICVDYSGGGLTPVLSQWCNGNSWRGWLGSWLAIAVVLFAAGAGLALATAQAAWIIPAMLLSAVAVWAGFTVPQEVAGASIVAGQPGPSIVPPPPHRQPSAPSTMPGRSRLELSVPRVLPSARPRGLAHDITPATLFGCPRDHEVAESASGPGVITNFDTVHVERGPSGLCATFTSAEIASFAAHQEETEVVSLTFTPHGSSRASSTPGPRSFSIEVWAANEGRTYSLILRRGHRTAQIVSVGNLGLARGHLSILIDQPRLPSWILNGKSGWSASLT
jgi:hypothetical protein